MDSTNTLPQVSQSASQREVVVNDLFAAAVTIFGRNGSTSVGLVWGYLGGRMNGTSVANGTVTATASTVCYVVVHRTTLVTSISTSNTNWNNTATYGRAYLLTPGSATVPTYEDHRFGTGGILTPDGSAYQPLDSDLTTIAGLTATTDSFMQAKSSAWAARTLAQVSTDLVGSGLITDAVGFRTVPQNSQSAAYTTVAADSGKHILHPAADTNARTFTIDSNANVAYPVGTAITFVNETSQVVSIAITSDTLTLAGTTTTGTRSLAQNGVATALKVTSTKWIISGTGLT